MSNVNYVTFTIVLVLFLLVTLTGFAAARWRRAEDMMHLNEWGLGGRSFGTFVAWFLLGGDLYTAYTFIAVPAAVFGAGAVTGFFAVSYTIMVFPIALIFLPRLWSIARTHNYITPADFVRGRYGSRGLSLATAFTGILALMPYIALQLVGIQAVLTVMGVGTSSTNTYVKDLPLFIAFVVLAIYTYVSGLRAPALIAFIKDILVYVMVIVAVFYIPTRIGGWGHIFAAAAGPPEGDQPGHAQAERRVHPHHGQQPAGVLDPGPGFRAGPDGLPARGHRRPVHQAARHHQAQHGAAADLLGHARLRRAARLHGPGRQGDGRERQEGRRNAQLAVPYLFQHMFPSWFTGVAFSAIVIGALVPAAIMAIASANLFTRNIFKEFFKPDASPRLETQVARWASLVVKLGALAFAVELPRTFSINLQLLGGIWILQVFPAIVFGLFTRWFHRWALLAGWLAGMVFGTIAAYKVATPTTSHWAGSVDIEFGHTVYIGLTAIIINIAVSVILTLVFKATRVPEGADETLPQQYTADPAQAPAPAPAAIGVGTAGAAG